MCASIVDGVTAPSDIENIFASNLRSLLNSNSAVSRDTMHNSIKSSLTATQLQDVVMM